MRPMTKGELSREMCVCGLSSRLYSTLACGDWRLGEAMLIGIDDQFLRALNSDLLEDRGQRMGRPYVDPR